MLSLGPKYCEFNVALKIAQKQLSRDIFCWEKVWVFVVYCELAIRTSKILTE